jgi:RNA polymerase sigma factor (sigma-70 family)
MKHKALVEKCKDGDRGSQNELFHLYVEAMYNTAMRMLGSKEDSEDIIQESFLEAFKNLNSFRYESTIGAWLKRIVVNKCINFLKMKRIPVVAVEDHEYHLTEEPTISKDNIDTSKIKKGIALLPKGFKQIINLYLIEGYDHTEIGDILDISVSTSKSQYHRAKKKLFGIINQL